MVKTSPSNAGSAGSIPGRGAKIPHASGPKNQNIKQKQYCNKFNKDFKNGPHQKKSLKKQKRISGVHGHSSPEPKPTLQSQRTEPREAGAMPTVTQHRPKALTPSLSI